MTFDLAAAGTAFIVMAVVPAMEGGAAGAKRIICSGDLFFRGMPPFGIAGSIGCCNGRG